MFDITNGILRTSVRMLVEFFCRSGSIDNRFRGITDSKAMEAGSKAHKKIQKAMGPDYKSEVPLSICVAGELYDIVVEGRADGIFEQDEIVYIDEIKGTYKDIRYLSEAYYVHKAQAMCYGYIYGMEEGLEKIGIRMTYVNLYSEDIKYFEEVFSIEYITEWFNKLLAELVKWGDYSAKHRISRNASIKALDFPFEYRDGQRNLAVNVYKSIENKNNLYIQAPTGVGKTISTVFPSVKAIGSELGDKIFYLTAKTITRTAAEEAFSLLRNKGLDFTTITITAKDKICLLESENGPECNPMVCPYANGHFDRINEALFNMITNESVITRDIIEKYAKEYMVCPFELCLDATYWRDGIVCDYNYAFDPNVKLKRFFSDGNRGEYIFLVDEAHNLVDRAREMYSASLYKDDFLVIKKLVAGLSKRLTNALEKCNKSLLEYKRSCDDEYEIIDTDELFSLEMMRLEKELTNFMENNRNFPYMDDLAQFFFNVMHFNEMREIADSNYVRYCEHTEQGFMYKLFCVNPANNIRACVDKGRMAVFFSATLLPVNYYKELLTGDRDECAIYANSPFDVNKRLLMIGRDVTSKYTRRNEKEYHRVKDYIIKITEAKKGNYLIFFHTTNIWKL